MPNFDHTGPEGLGPKTGMKLGRCKMSASDANTFTDKRPFCNGRRKKTNQDKVERLNLKEMRKIAIPITRENQIENHFGRSKYYEIYLCSSNNEILDVQLLETDHKRACKSNIFNELANSGVSYLLSGSMGDNAYHKLNDAGISVVRGCSGNSSDVILKFMANEISDNDEGCSAHNKKHNHNHSCHN